MNAAGNFFAKQVISERRPKGIFFSDAFFLMNDPNFASCTVDNTPYVKSDSMQDMIKKLENDLIKFWE